MATTTFILGAGLGKEYGFPDGTELRNLIVNELEDREKELKEILQISYALTVDEVAKRYSKHADRIRRIVAKILRDREDVQKLVRNDDNTYKLLLRQVAKAESKGDQVNIITYNYDRSLPYLVHRLNSIETDQRNKIRAQIIHVHGRLAPLGHEDLNRQRNPRRYHNYGTENMYSGEFHYEFPNDGSLEIRIEQTMRDDEVFENLFRASNFDFIGDDIEPRKELGEILKASNTIVFLGVAYHEANMNVLGYDFNSGHGQFVVGTGFGLGEEQIALIKQQYPVLQEIIPCKAHEFLRAHLDISRPERSLLKRKASMFDEDVLGRFSQVITDSIAASQSLS
ncbi:MAG: hypothetical protein AB7K68_14965 [Bacteriovoracia bacterium]